MQRNTSSHVRPSALLAACATLHIIAIRATSSRQGPYQSKGTRCARAGLTQRRSGLRYGSSSRIARAATTCCRILASRRRRDGSMPPRVPPWRCTPLTGSIMWKLSPTYGQGRAGCPSPNGGTGSSGMLGGRNGSRVRVMSGALKAGLALASAALTQHDSGCPVSASSFRSMLQKAQRPSDRRPP